MSSDIKERCEAVAAAAADALDWLQHPSNVELVGASAGAIRRNLRRDAIRARKLADAAGRPMCMSVFGPSQSGKSYLVSLLARPRDGELYANFPTTDGSKGALKFIDEINPQNEGESTGLVTRFTVRAYQAPDGYPVKLRVLGEADVARILLNSFQLDGDASEEIPTAEEIEQTVARLRERARSQPVGGLGADEVSEIQEYARKMFGKTGYIGALEPFWEEAIKLAPYLAVADRATLLAVVWGRHEAFTALYRRLGEALAELDHPGEVYVPLDALQPREDSIIDVMRLCGLDQEGSTPLNLVTPEGRRATWPKAVITALTAELVIPMLEKSHELFERTDLLDFPGARSRVGRPLGDFLAKASDPLKECFLRGKVAYLFDRYVADQEITTMLLCIQDSNMEVGGLPALVDDWIAHTHGNTPAVRGQNEKLLFFILTKFDRHLTDTAGTGRDDSARFNNRIQYSLLEKFATMPDSWPLNWTGGETFDNCFWLRNPHYPNYAFFEYEDEREIGYRSGSEERREQLKAGCIAAELVQRHFRDPETAWDAAMTVNDGGVSYLVGNLTPVSRAEVKSRQLAVQLTETGARLSRELARFHVSDDLTQRLDERRATAQALMAELLRVFEHRLFGALLDELTLRPELLAQRFKRQPANIRFVSSHAAKPSGAGVVLPGAGTIGAGEVILPGSGAPATLACRPAPDRGARTEEKRTLTRSQWRAEIAFALWVDTLKTFGAAENVQQRFSLSPAAASELTGELIAGARRVGLEAAIEREVDKNQYVERNDASVERTALIATETLNAFVVEAGAAFVPLEQRPEISTPEGLRKPFPSRDVVHNIDSLSETPRRPDADFLTDWMHMIYRMFEDNARDSADGEVDPEQNGRLGRILETFAAA